MTTDTPAAHNHEPHDCPGCGKSGIRWDMFGCRPCWLMLPWENRDRIMQTWHHRLRTGETLQHMAAKSDALDWYRLHHPKHRKV